MAQTTFDMIDKQLRPAGRMLKMVARPSKRGFRLMHWVLSRAKGKDMDGADSRTVWVERSGDTGKIRTRVFRPKDSSSPLPIVLCLHGGGHAFGIAEQDSCLQIYEGFMRTRDCVIVW